MTEKKEVVENKKAAKEVISTSIRALRLDVALTQFIHTHSTAYSTTGVRMKTIMSQSQFSLISETTIRHHLKSLCTRGVLQEDKMFRGMYVLDEGGYYEWVRDLQKYLERIVGFDLFKTIVDSIRR